jgi:nucleoside-diphosphate-sugar epimerase
MFKNYLITGGSGFIGSSIVKSLVEFGHNVKVIDNNSRGKISRLESVQQDINFVEGDIRDSDLLIQNTKGIDCIIHLAYINGTELFYTKPDEVLDVAIKGMTNLLDSAIRNNVPEFFLASSSEVYQTPKDIPTKEDVQLVVPDILNPRYSYGGGKIACELMAINFGKKYFKRMVIFRPHNVYGPDMGNMHVVPELINKAILLSKNTNDTLINFPIQGSGSETRAFTYIDDFTNAVICLLKKGEHLNIYHIGNQEETSIKELVEKIFNALKINPKIVPGELLKGSTLRRCPDITKISRLGFKNEISLDEGIKKTVEWHLKQKS